MFGSCAELSDFVADRYQLAQYLVHWRVGEDIERSCPTDVLRLPERHGLPRRALCPDQALDPYWGNPSTTHTLLAD